MTKFTEDEQRIGDWDWFGVDVTGSIGVFATNGARLLPPAVAADREAWSALYDFLDALPAAGEGRVCPKLSERPRWRNERERTGYLEGFLDSAARGLYAYDSESPQEGERLYLRVAIPDKKLKIEDLPREMREIVGRTPLPVSFAEATDILEPPDSCGAEE